MKARNIVIFGLGVVAGLLLAPKKGRESYDELSEKMNDMYLQVKELDIDTIKDKVDDIKIEISKMDYDHSKEVISKQSQVIKEKLGKMIEDLQKNKKIQPALEGAIDSTEKAIIDVIDYIDENELIDKTKEGMQRAHEKSTEYAMNLKEKTGEVIEKTNEKAAKVVEKVKKRKKDSDED